MPTYDYKCTECGIIFEVFQKMSDEPIENCLECNGEVRRLIGGGLTPIFKGNGFYETDYKAKSNKTVEPAKNTATKNGENKTKNDSPNTEKNEAKSQSKKIENAEIQKTEKKKIE